MKNLILLFSVSLIALSSFTIAGKWELLGSRQVRYGLDRDEILVTGNEGRFEAIQIRVKRSAINMHKCVVHFGDGTEQEVELKNNFRAGDESRIINLEGNNRIIRKVVFWYDTKNNRKNTAVVELWGKH